LVDLISSGLLVCLLLVPSSQGDPCLQEMDQLRTQVNRQIKEKVSLLGLELKALVKEEIKAALEDERRVTRKNVEIQVSEMLAMMEKLQAENNALRKRMDDKKEMTEELGTIPTRGAQSPKFVIPSMGSCAYRYLLSSNTSETITYDSLLTDWNEGAEGLMDIESGQYTVISPPGFYSISFSGQAGLDQGEQVALHLHQNGESLKESEWRSQSKDTSANSYIVDFGSRTMILHLDMGDTLELRTDQINNGPTGELWRLTFCVSLVAPDSTTYQNA